MNVPKDFIKVSAYKINKYRLVDFVADKNLCPYEYRGDWEKFIETALPRREYFYNHHLKLCGRKKSL